ncbi:unnamed protein product [Cuscuta europaea]|uniref:Uncharacterized protein n=1 Tax=Cuscuta europaea TaxID=41803 RepID=A0A9P1EC82_CUSEU|nr:unnamed protein product [Cuscuta europaea]
MCADALWILKNFKGASSSSQPMVDEERVARLEKELQELQEQQEEERREREKVAKMQAQMDEFFATWRSPMHQMQPQMPPQVSFMSSMGLNSSPGFQMPTTISNT